MAYPKLSTGKPHLIVHGSSSHTVTISPTLECLPPDRHWRIIESFWILLLCDCRLGSGSENTWESLRETGHGSQLQPINTVWIEMRTSALSLICLLVLSSVLSGVGFSPNEFAPFPDQVYDFDIGEGDQIRLDSDCCWSAYQLTTLDGAELSAVVDYRWGPKLQGSGLDLVVGESKREVIAHLGKPGRVSRTWDSEYWDYDQFAFGYRFEFRDEVVSRIGVFATNSEI